MLFGIVVNCRLLTTDEGFGSGIHRLLLDEADMDIEALEVNKVNTMLSIINKGKEMFAATNCSWHLPP